MGNSQNPQLGGRLSAQKSGYHLEREKKALDKVRRLVGDEKERETDRIKAKDRVSVNSVVQGFGTDLETNLVEPLKKWSGFTALQECSQPKAHIDSEDELESEVPRKPKLKSNSFRVQTNTAKSKVRSMILDVHPDYEPPDKR